MSEAAVPIEDFAYDNLRVLADRLLETTRVEYVDEGVLLVMNPPGTEHHRHERLATLAVRQVNAPLQPPAVLASPASPG